MKSVKKDIIDQLRQNILQMEGFAAPHAAVSNVVGLGGIESAFPNGVFPIGAIHEFLTFQPEHNAVTDAFISGIISTLMQQGGACIWVGRSRKVFPPALNFFGLLPHQVVFADMAREKDILWVMEEALKCKGLAAVVAEVQELNFMQSRRLQLAVEQSKVTGFVFRNDPIKISTTACVARWQITPSPSLAQDGMPGVGFPRWNVELLRVRNGKPGKWLFEWRNGTFNEVIEQQEYQTLRELTLQAG